MQYVRVTRALGGTPTAEGVGVAFGLGGLLAGAAFGGTFAAGEAAGLGPRLSVPAGAKGFANGRAAQRTATGNERFSRYYDQTDAQTMAGAKGSGSVGRYGATEGPTKSSLAARLLYRLDKSGNKAPYGETFSLKPETKYYVGRTEGSIFSQVWFENLKAFVPGPTWGMRRI